MAGRWGDVSTYEYQHTLADGLGGCIAAPDIAQCADLLAELVTAVDRIEADFLRRIAPALLGPGQ